MKKDTPNAVFLLKFHLVERWGEKVFYSKPIQTLLHFNVNRNIRECLEEHVVLYKWFIEERRLLINSTYDW